MNPETIELPLRDIHPAAAPPWWPPAPGWWALALLAALALTALGWLAWRRFRRYRRRRALSAELAGLVSHWQARRDDRSFVVALSAFLRRLVVHAGKRTHAAGLSGAAWAEYLAHPIDDPAEREACAALVEAPYRRDGAVPHPERLVPVARHWIRRVTEARDA